MFSMNHWVHVLLWNKSKQTHSIVHNKQCTYRTHIQWSRLTNIEKPLMSRNYLITSMHYTRLTYSAIQIFMNVYHQRWLYKTYYLVKSDGWELTNPTRPHLPNICLILVLSLAALQYISLWRYFASTMQYTAEIRLFYFLRCYRRW